MAFQVTDDALDNLDRADPDQRLKFFQGLSDDERSQISAALPAWKAKRRPAPDAGQPPASDAGTPTAFAAPPQFPGPSTGALLRGGVAGGVGAVAKAVGTVAGVGSTALNAADTAYQATPIGWASRNIVAPTVSWLQKHVGEPAFNAYVAAHQKVGSAIGVPPDPGGLALARQFATTFTGDAAAEAHAQTPEGRKELQILAEELGGQGPAAFALGAANIGGQVAPFVVGGAGVAKVAPEASAVPFLARVNQISQAVGKWSAAQAFTTGQGVPSAYVKGRVVGAGLGVVPATASMILTRSAQKGIAREVASKMPVDPNPTLNEPTTVDVAPDTQVVHVYQKVDQIPATDFQNAMAIAYKRDPAGNVVGQVTVRDPTAPSGTRVVTTNIEHPDAAAAFGNASVRYTGSPPEVLDPDIWETKGRQWILKSMGDEASGILAPSETEVPTGDIKPGRGLLSPGNRTNAATPQAKEADTQVSGPPTRMPIDRDTQVMEAVGYPEGAKVRYLPDGKTVGQMDAGYVRDVDPARGVVLVSKGKNPRSDDTWVSVPFSRVGTVVGSKPPTTGGGGPPPIAPPPGAGQPNPPGHPLPSAAAAINDKARVLMQARSIRPGVGDWIFGDKAGAAPWTADELYDRAARARATGDTFKRVSDAVSRRLGDLGITEKNTAFDADLRAVHEGSMTVDQFFTKHPQLAQASQFFEDDFRRADMLDQEIRRMTGRPDRGANEGDWRHYLAELFVTRRLTGQATLAMTRTDQEYAEAGQRLRDLALKRGTVLSDAEVTNTLYQVLNAEDRPATLYASRVGQAAFGHLKSPTDIDPVIRKFLGGNAPMALRWAVGRSAQEALYNHLKLMEEVAQDPKVSSTIPDYRLGAAGGHAVPNDKNLYGPLAGMFVDGPTWQRVVNTAKATSPDVIGQNIRGAQSLTKANEVIANPNSWIKTTLKNYVFDLFSGGTTILDPKGYLEASKQAVQALAEYGQKASTPEGMGLPARVVKALTDRGILSGFNESDVDRISNDMIRDRLRIADLGSLGEWNKYVLDKVKNLSGPGLVKTATGGKWDMGKAWDLWQHQIPKIRSALSQVHGYMADGMGEEEATRRAAKKVDAFYPNMMHAGKITDFMRSMAGFPLSSWGAIRGEELRVYANVARALAHGDGELAARLGAGAALTAGVYGANSYLRHAAGVTDDEVAALKDRHGPTTWVLPLKDSEGNVAHFDFGDVFGPLAELAKSNNTDPKFAQYVNNVLKWPMGDVGREFVDANAPRLWQAAGVHMASPPQPRNVPGSQRDYAADIDTASKIGMLPRVIHGGLQAMREAMPQSPVHRALPAWAAFDSELLGGPSWSNPSDARLQALKQQTGDIRELRRTLRTIPFKEQSEAVKQGEIGDTVREIERVAGMR